MVVTFSVFLLVAGIYLIREIFMERKEAQQKMQQQLDELQRFHQVTISRELRMKELYEENQALKAQIGKPGK